MKMSRAKLFRPDGSFFSVVIVYQAP
jgi:hypothetical protein